MVRRQSLAEVRSFGDAAVVVRFGGGISSRGHARVMALLAALDARRLAGVRDLTPAYTSLLVQFDPLVTSQDQVTTAVCEALEQAEEGSRAPSRLVTIPVAYGGADGPDLDEVARLAGLTPSEVITRHTGASYRVYFLGFQAGFPYLGGLPAEIAVPRLDRPRSRVPAGSVAIAERQAGIYPATSPGGWRILGRTSARLWDPAADPPSLLRPGDRVRFVAVDAAARPGPHAAALLRPTADPAEMTALVPAGAPALRVLRPGPFTTIQDLGRWGYARYGVSVGGAADEEALRQGNALLGNDEGAAAFEITLGNCAFEALTPSVFVLTGADCRASVDGRSVAQGTPFELVAGQTLELGVAERGVRAYLCAAGGVDVPLVLGSRSTDVRASLGGLDGRSLRAGDLLYLCGGDDPNAAGPRSVDVSSPEPNTEAPTVLRVLPGLNGESDAGGLAGLLAMEFVVDPLSDRMGVRLNQAGDSQGAGITGGQIISAGVPRGAVQIPPGGEPIILLADAQTTGGYAVPAVVISSDLGPAGQLRPGDRVRFVCVSLAEAIGALQERPRRRAALLAASERRSHPDDMLWRGFAEWSEAADPRA